MISSVFGKTKPVNYIILICSTFVLYVIANLNQDTSDWTLVEWGKQLLVLCCLFFEIFLINFIVQRNQITRANTFVILLYTTMFMVFPEVLTNAEGIFCSLFVLLGLRRLISIRSLKQTNYKIFDATLWLIIASLFYPWAVLFILLIWSVVYLFEPKSLQNWLLPFSALIAVGLSLVSILLLFDKMSFLPEHFNFSFNPEASWNQLSPKLTTLGVVLSLTFVLGIMAYLRLNKSGQAQLLVMRIVGMHLIITLLFIALSAMHKEAPLILFFFPVAVMLTRYVESIRKPRFKDGVLFLIIGVSATVFALKLVLK